MPESDKLFGQLPIVLALLHLCTCVVFLFGYAAGFGSGVGALFGAGDLFSIGLSDLSWVYITGLSFPTVIILYRIRPGYVSYAEKIRQTDADGGVERLASNARFFKLVILFIAVADIVLFSGGAFLAQLYDERIPLELLAAGIPAAITFSWLEYASYFKTKYTTDLAVAALLCLLFSALLTGLSRGQAERRTPVKFLSDRMRCDENIILRPAGANFIAVLPDERRVIISSECKKLFEYPKKTAFAEVSTYDLLLRWLGSGH